jgi:hypothetical protein
MDDNSACLLYEAQLGETPNHADQVFQQSHRRGVPDCPRRYNHQEVQYIMYSCRDLHLQ